MHMQHQAVFGILKTMRLYLLIILIAVCGFTVRSQTPETAAKFRLAQSYEQAGEFERAAELYQQLCSREPTNYVFFDALQRMYTQLKRYDDAIDLIQQRLATAPADLNLRGMLGTVYYRAGREKEAVEEWESALDLQPSNPQYYRVIAAIMTENRLLERAADVYRRARIACKDENLFTLELAQLLVVSMNYAGATSEYIRWLDQNPTQLGYIQSRLATFSWKDDGRSAAINVVRRALEHKDNLRLYEILSWLYTEGRQFGEALDVQRTIDRLSNAQGVALLGFADRAYRERAYSVAAQAYKDALERSLPVQRIPQAKYGYACALAEVQSPVDTTGDDAFPLLAPISETRVRFEGPLTSFAAIVAEFPNSEYAVKSLYQIGDIHFRRYFDLDNARRSFEQILVHPAARNIDRYSARLRLGEIDVAKGATSQAVQQYQAVFAATDAIPDQNDEAAFRLAELAYFRGQFKEALSILSALSLNSKADYANDAIQLLTFLQENSTVAPEALKQFGRADLLSRQKKNSEAIQTFLDVVRQFPQAPLADASLMHIAALQVEAGMYQDAIVTYERVLKEYKETGKTLDRAQFRVGEIYQFGLHTTAKAIAAYEHVLTDYPQSVLGNEARKRIRQLRGDSL
jgi:tetratricopeptide (TPR) repeat protein